MLYWVVTFERMYVLRNDAVPLALTAVPRLYMLAAMSLNLWILIVIVRQVQAHSLRSS